MTEIEQRAAIVAEALTWEGTPYHHEGRVKGREGGVDCGMLIYEVYRACGLIPETEIAPYSEQFHLHRDREDYLGYLERFGAEVNGDQARPGDAVIYKMGRCHSHAAIIIAWPKIIHATAKSGLVRTDEATQPYFSKYERKFFSLWAKANASADADKRS